MKRPAWNGREMSRVEPMIRAAETAADHDEAKSRKTGSGLRIKSAIRAGGIQPQHNRFVLPYEE